MPRPTPTTKRTKVANIVEKKGDHYEKQLRNFEEKASYYYSYIFGGEVENIKASDTSYIPPSVDIDNIFKKIPNLFKYYNDIDTVDNQINIIEKEDYCIGAGIRAIINIVSDNNNYLNFFNKHHRAIIFTISHKERTKGIQSRLELLKYIINNKDISNFKMKDYFNGLQVDKPEEQTRELSCIIQNIHNRIFPGFYIDKEIHALFKLITGNNKIAYKDIQGTRESLSPKIKRILPNPYRNILDLLAICHGNPPHPFPPERTL